MPIQIQLFIILIEFFFRFGSVRYEKWHFSMKNWYGVSLADSMRSQGVLIYAQIYSIQTRTNIYGRYAAICEQIFYQINLHTLCAVCCVYMAESTLKLVAGCIFNLFDCRNTAIVQMRQLTTATTSPSQHCLGHKGGRNEMKREMLNAGQRARAHFWIITVIAKCPLNISTFSMST